MRGNSNFVGINFPRDIEKAILALPVLDLLMLDLPTRNLLLKVYHPRLKRILSVNPFLRILPNKKSFPRPIKVVDLSKAMDRRGYRKKVGGLWKQALLSIRGVVRQEAIDYFLSGPFPRNCIWLEPEEYEYISLISELTNGRYILLCIDVKRMDSYWSIYRWIDLVHRIVSQGDLFVLISSNDDGTVAETISNLYRSRSLSISYRSHLRYLLALMSKARVVLGSDLEQAFLGAYLRDGTIGLVSRSIYMRDFELWEEGNFVIHEKISPSSLAREVYSLVEKMEAKLTREERELWSQPWNSVG